jgi:hypothetical protein
MHYAKKTKVGLARICSPNAIIPPQISPADALNRDQKTAKNNSKPATFTPSKG